MRDSLGGLTTIVIIVVFIVIASGYLAFNVNYTKAFRMKDKIISIYDAYNGQCNLDCQNDIKAYANQIGYLPETLNCDRYGVSVDGDDKDGYYCLYTYINQSTTKNTDDPSIPDDKKNRVYYKVITKINVSIPILNNVFDFRIFTISGDTKVYTLES